MTHRVLNKHKARSVILTSTKLGAYYAPSFVLVEHSVYHEPIFVLINVIMHLA